MSQSIAVVLGQADIFDNLTANQLELVSAICEPATHHQGEVLIHENASTDEMYVIAEGGVEVLINPGVVSADQTEMEPVVVAELRAGQVFGEVALVDQGIRSATVRVSRDKTLVMCISRQRLMLLCDTYPELGFKLMKNLAADLALKIRHTDLTIRQLQLMLSQRSAGM